MKYVFSTLLIALCLVAGLSSPTSHAKVDMSEISSLVYDLEYRYQPNIKLIPQFPPVDGPTVWKKDLIRLSEILDQQVQGRQGELTTLACDKLVCACENVVCNGEIQP